MISAQTYRKQTLTKYVENLGAKASVPGGGSAAALVAALGVALLSMAASYAQNKGAARSVNNRIRRIRTESRVLYKRLLMLVDADAAAYRTVVKSRGASSRVKKQAAKKARAVPHEVCRLCYRAVGLAPFLATHGSPHLLSDVTVAVELLSGAFASAMVIVEVNT